MDELDQQENETLSEWAERVVPIITNFADKFVAAIRPYFNALFDAIRKFYDWVYSIYLEDGAPNGKSREGMQLWFEQRVKENQEPHGLGIGRRGLSPG